MAKKKRKKGQGSLEYLLILAAILAIAVVVILVASSLISAPEESTLLSKDKYTAGLAGIQLIGYDKLYTGVPGTGPTQVIYQGITHQVVTLQTIEETAELSIEDAVAIFTIGKGPNEETYTMYIIPGNTGSLFTQILVENLGLQGLKGKELQLAIETSIIGYCDDWMQIYGEGGYLLTADSTEPTFSEPETTKITALALLAEETKLAVEEEPLLKEEVLSESVVLIRDFV